MIVAMNTNNSDKYLQLFTEAYEYLKALDNGYVEDKASGRFESLAEYYSHMSDFFSNQKYKFIMLPLDEESFTIDLDTRTITIPDSFSKCASVQSDQLAEMIIFTTDRYYDYMDLANTEIFVQWTIPENKTLGIEEFNGATRIEMVDLETEPGKLRFAWPINDKITQYAGNVKFSVRFFTLDPDNLNVVTYSLNTTEASLTIKAALQTSITDEADVESPLADSSFKKVILNSNFSNEGVLPPVQPAFTEPGSDIDAEGLFVVGEQRVAHLHDDEGALSVQAWSADAGEYRYEWYYKNNKENAGWYNCANYPILDENNRPIMNDEGEFADTIVWATAEDQYVEVEPTERVAHERYYYKVNDTYKLYTGAIPTDNQLYERYNVLNIPSTGEVTGYYKACVYNRIGNQETRNPVFSSSCLMPGPQKIAFKETGDLASGLIMADGGAALLQVGLEEDLYSPSIAYEWRKSQSAREEVLDEKIEVWEKTEDGSILVEEPAWYSVRVISTLNREQDKKFSTVCKVTNPPLPPLVETQDNPSVRIGTTPVVLSVATKVSNEANLENTLLLSEKFEYIWQLRPIDSEVFITVDEKFAGIEGQGTAELTINSDLSYNGERLIAAFGRCLVVNVLNGERAVFDHSGTGNFDETYGVFGLETPYIYEDKADDFSFSVINGQ